MQPDHPVPFKPRRARGRALALGGILLLSLGLNLWNIGFPLGFHRDEPKKVRFILQGVQDFHHPLLLLGEARAVNRVLRLEDPDQVAVLGRGLTAVNGALVVLVLFLLARRRLASPFDLLAALAVAVSPVLVIHAHYLKEDVLLTLFSTLTLLLLFRFLSRPTTARALLLGLGAGLALSSHYKSLLLFPVLAAVPFLGRFPRRRVIGGLCIAAGLAGLVFLAVDYPLLAGLSESRFLSGVSKDLWLVREGKDVRIDALPQLFTFHLRHSLAPGMTPAALLVALGGAAAALARWRRLASEERTLLLFLAVFYLGVELTPFKPFPDFMRYVLPLVPALAYFGARAAARVRSAMPGRAGAAGACALAAGLVLVPLQATLRLDHGLARDTRDEAVRRAEAGKLDIVYGNYATRDARRILADDDLDSLRASGVTHVAVASFETDRYAFAARLKGQDPGVYRRAERYEALLRLPHSEIRPAYRPFAFSNPIIRIVDIRVPEDGAAP